jgi:hypothetical protein
MIEFTLSLRKLLVKIEKVNKKKKKKWSHFFFIFIYKSLSTVLLHPYHYTIKNLFLRNYKKKLIITIQLTQT